MNPNGHTFLWCSADMMVYVNDRNGNCLGAMIDGKLVPLPPDISEEETNSMLREALSRKPTSGGE